MNLKIASFLNYLKFMMQINFMHHVDEFFYRIWLNSKRSLVWLYWLLPLTDIKPLTHYLKRIHKHFYKQSSTLINFTLNKTCYWQLVDLPVQIWIPFATRKWSTWRTWTWSWYFKTFFSPSMTKSSQAFVSDKHYQFLKVMLEEARVSI
jgi:hypothetical protein